MIKEKEIIMIDIESIEICYNTIRIRGYAPSLFKGKKPISILIGQIGIITNIISSDCKLTYPRDKILQSHAVKTIELGKHMD